VTNIYVVLFIKDASVECEDFQTAVLMNSFEYKKHKRLRNICVRVGSNEYICSCPVLISIGMFLVGPIAVFDLSNLCT
jgi:hypothetical protein